MVACLAGFVVDGEACDHLPDAWTCASSPLATGSVLRPPPSLLIGRRQTAVDKLRQ